MSVWKTDKRPKNNTIEKELKRLQRIHDMLLQAVLSGKKKHQLNDLEELKDSIDELIFLFNEE